MKLHFNIFIYTYTYFDLSDVIEKARVNLKKIYNIRQEFNNLIKIHDNIVLHLFFKKKTNTKYWIKEHHVLWATREKFLHSGVMIIWQKFNIYFHLTQVLSQKRECRNIHSDGTATLKIYDFITANFKKLIWHCCIFIDYKKQRWKLSNDIYNK